MSDTLELILDTADKLFGQYCDKDIINQAEAGGFANELWQQIETTGLLLAGLPEQYGGIGGDIADFFRVLEVAGKHCIPLPLAETYIARLALYQAGVEVPDGPLSLVAEGQQVAFGRFCSAAVIIPEQHDQALSLIAIDPSGIEQGQNYAGEACDRLMFTSVDTTEVKTQQPSQWWYALAALSRGALMSGGLQYLLDSSVDYALQRKQFGRPIAKFQAVQQQLAVLAGQFAQGRQAVRVAALTCDTAGFIRSVAVAKSVAGEAAGIGSEIAHQVLGAMGFTYEHDMHHRSRRLWSWRDQWGNEAQWNIYLGKQIAATDPDHLWRLLTA